MNKLTLSALKLSTLNLDKLIQFEKNARISEPDVFIHDFDEVKFRSETLNALNHPLFASARCLICVNIGGGDGDVIGRIDFSIHPSFAFGGDLRVYVDWVYVLKEYRHKGVAQFLFQEMEKTLTELDINNYFLIAAENEEAQRFYGSLKNAQIEKQDLLTKVIEAPTFRTQPCEL